FTAFVIHFPRITPREHRPRAHSKRGKDDVRALLAVDATYLEALWQVLGLLSIPALVALNGFFVAAEFSLVAVRRTRVEEMIARGIVRARTVLHAVDNLSRSIAATQL